MTSDAPAFSRIPHAPRSDDPAALESLAEALAAVDYSYDGVLALLGEGPFEAMARDQIAPARHRVRTILAGTAAMPDGARVTAGRRRLAGAVDFFLLAGTLSAEALDATLGEGAARLLDHLGFLTPASEDPETDAPDAPAAAPRYRAAFDLRPHSADDGTDLWVASDLGAHQHPGALPADHVLGIGQASLTLAQITERRPVDTALDLGTGCGIQTFHLLAHARHVTATDLSERALAFTRFNLVLNAAALGLDPAHPEQRVRLLRGSLLEPVAGQRFELIVSNPPFVITPRTPGEDPRRRYTYRDGGMAGDQLVERLVRELPEHLVPGGRAQLLANWEIPATAPGQQADWDTRPRQWVGAETEAWFVQREELTPEGYAQTWLRDASQQRDPAAYEEAFLAYLEDFAARGVAAVGFGMVWLRRPAESEAPADAEGRALRRFEEITHPLQQPLAPFLTAAVAAHDAAASLDDAALREQHLTVGEDVTEERHQRPGAEHPGVILLRQGAGFRRTELLSTQDAGFVSACDGELSVGQILDALGALLGWEGPDPAVALLARVRTLVERGFLVLPETTSGAAPAAG
ncbi:methyltransferase [Rothia kristinae]|uniref:methyltransferase n=1 Tax=Rothia kristinae TaxID=37923 RepID=UPI0018C92DE7|nr:methyltransferase [Rothia kristinae]